MREEDYEHYNKIIVSLSQTHKIMGEIDEILNTKEKNVSTKI